MKKLQKLLYKRRAGYIIKILSLVMASVLVFGSVAFSAAGNEQVGGVIEYDWDYDSQDTVYGPDGEIMTQPPAADYGEEYTTGRTTGEVVIADSDGVKVDTQSEEISQNDNTPEGALGNSGVIGFSEWSEEFSMDEDSGTTIGDIISFEENGLNFTYSLFNSADFSGTIQTASLNFSVTSGGGTEFVIPDGKLQARLTLPSKARVVDSGVLGISSVFGGENSSTDPVFDDGNIKYLWVTWVKSPSSSGSTTSFGHDVYFRTVLDGVTDHNEKIDIPVAIFFDGQKSQKTATKSFTAMTTNFAWNKVVTTIKTGEEGSLSNYINTNVVDLPYTTVGSDKIAKLPKLWLSFSDTYSHTSDPSATLIGNAFAQRADVVDSYKVSSKDGVNPDILFKESDINTNGGTLSNISTVNIGGVDYIKSFTLTMPIVSTDTTKELVFAGNAFSISNAVVNPAVYPSLTGDSYVASVEGVATNAVIGTITPLVNVNGIDKTPQNLINAAKTYIKFRVNSLDTTSDTLKTMYLNKYISSGGGTVLGEDVVKWTGEEVIFGINAFENAQGGDMSKFSLADSFDNSQLYAKTIYTGKYAKGTDNYGSGVKLRITFDDNHVLDNVSLLTDNTYYLASLLSGQPSPYSDPTRINKIEFLYDSMQGTGALASGVPAGFKVTKAPRISFFVRKNTDGAKLTNTATLTYKYRDNPEQQISDSAYVNYQTLPTTTTNSAKDAYNLSQGSTPVLVDSNNPPSVGDILAFTIKVKNTAAAPVRNITITDYYSDGLGIYSDHTDVPTDFQTSLMANAKILNQTNINISSITTGTGTAGKYMVFQLDGGILQPGETVDIRYLMKLESAEVAPVGPSKFRNYYEALADYTTGTGGTGGNRLEIGGGFFNNNATPGDEKPSLDFVKSITKINGADSAGDNTNYKVGDVITFNLTLNYLRAPQNEKMNVYNFMDGLPAGIDYQAGSAKLYLKRAADANPSEITNGITVSSYLGGDVDATVKNKNVTKLAINSPIEISVGDKIMVELDAKITDAALLNETNISAARSNYGFVFLKEANDSYIAKSGGIISTKTGYKDTNTAGTDTQGLDLDVNTKSYLKSQVDFAIRNNLIKKIGVIKTTNSYNVVIGNSAKRVYYINIYNYGTAPVDISNFVDILPRYEKLSIDASQGFTQSVSVRKYGSNGGITATTTLTQGTDYTVTDVDATHKKLNLNPSDLTATKKDYFTIPGVAAGDANARRMMTIFVVTELEEDKYIDYFNSLGQNQSTNTVADINYTAVYFGGDGEYQVNDTYYTTKVLDSVGIDKIENSTDWNNNGNKTEIRYQAQCAVSVQAPKIIPAVKTQSLVYFNEAGTTTYKKFVVGEDTVAPGAIIGFKISAMNNASATDFIKKGSKIVVEIPDTLEYIPGSVKATTANETVPGAAPNYFVNNEPTLTTNAVGNKVLTWELSADIGTVLNKQGGVYFIFQTRTPDKNYSSYTVMSYLVPKHTQFFLGTDVRAKYTYGVDELIKDYGLLTTSTAGGILHMVRHSDMINVFGSFGLSTLMSVTETGDTTNTQNSLSAEKYGGIFPRTIGIGNASDDFYYTFDVSNNANREYKDIVILNRLSRVGDKASYGGDGRNSEVGVVLKNSNIALSKVKDNAVLATYSVGSGAGQYKIEYTTVPPNTTFGLQDWNQKDSGGVGGWQTLDSAVDLKTVTAFRLIVGSDIKLEGGQSFRMTYSANFNQDEYIRNNMVAYNAASVGFYFQASNDPADKEALIAEPYNVGVVASIAERQLKINKTLVTHDNALNTINRDFYFKVTHSIDTSFQQIVKVTVPANSNTGTSSFSGLKRTDGQYTVTEVADAAGNPLSSSYSYTISGQGVMSSSGGELVSNITNTERTDYIKINKNVVLTTPGKTLSGTENTFYFEVVGRDTSNQVKYSEVVALNVSKVGDDYQGSTAELATGRYNLTYTVTEVADALGTTRGSSFPYTALGEGVMTLASNLHQATITNTERTDFVRIDKTVTLPTGQELTTQAEKTFYFRVVGKDSGGATQYNNVISLEVSKVLNEYKGSSAQLATGKFALNYTATEVADAAGTALSNSFPYIISGEGMMTKSASGSAGEQISVADISNISKKVDYEQIIIKKVLEDNQTEPVQKIFEFKVTGTKSGQADYLPNNITIEVFKDSVSGKWLGEKTITVPGIGYTYSLEEINHPSYKVEIDPPVKTVVTQGSGSEEKQITVSTFTAKNSPDYQKFVLKKSLEKDAVVPPNKTFVFDVVGKLGDGTKVFEEAVSVTVDHAEDGSYVGSSKEYVIAGADNVITFTIAERDSIAYIYSYEKEADTADANGMTVFNFKATNKKLIDNKIIINKKVTVPETQNPKDTTFYFKVTGVPKIAGIQPFEAVYPVSVTQSGGIWTGSTGVINVPAGLEFSAEELSTYSNGQGVNYQQSGNYIVKPEPIVTTILQDGTTQFNFSFINESQDITNYEWVVIEKELLEDTTAPTAKSFKFILSGYDGTALKFGPMEVIVDLAKNGSSWKGISNEIKVPYQNLNYKIEEVGSANYNYNNPSPIFTTKTDGTDKRIVTFKAVNKTLVPDYEVVVINKTMYFAGANPPDTDFSVWLIGTDASGAEKLRQMHTITVSRGADGVWRGTTGEITKLPLGLNYRIVEIDSGIYGYTGSYYVSYSRSVVGGVGIEPKATTLNVVNSFNTGGSGGGGGGSDGGGGSGGSDGPSYSGYTTGGTTSGGGITIDDGTVPLAKPNYTTILEDDVPLGNLPQTGSTARADALQMGIGALIVAAGLAIVFRKNKGIQDR